MAAGPTERDVMRRGDSSYLESRERQLRLWNMTLTARYIALTVGAILCLFPIAGPQHWWIAAALVGVALPYNALNHWIMRRHGRLSPTLAFSDQVLALTFMALLPALIQPILMVMLAITATSSVAAKE